MRLRGEKEMLHSKKRWRVQETDTAKAEELASQLSVSPLVASLLINRDITTADEARNFLYLTDDNMHDPYLLKDMDIVVERIQRAIRDEEKIMIYGDYDADGVSSTSVMLTTLRTLGAHVDFYIPNRFTEGYGPNEGAFRHIGEQGYTLVITVDTGISGVNEADVAEECGFDLIITDHHEPGPELPKAFAIIHPKLSERYPFKELAGVGVALKIGQALLGEISPALVELAAIGTVADLVPLQDENRYIVQKGLHYLRHTNRPGMKALLNVCGVNQKEITEETIGFAIGPRINAIGRLDQADPAVHLLMTADQEEAESLAEEIDQCNQERRTIVKEITDQAIEMVKTQFPPEENAVLVLAKEGWNPGVIGIVASRLVNEFYRPTIVLGIDEEGKIAKGSARSIEGFDLFANLSKCRDILPHFGGHPMAAGMTLELENVPLLREKMNKFGHELLSEEDFIPAVNIDVNASLDEITTESIEELNKLAPFGISNPKPKVLIKDVPISSMRKIGADKTHLKVVVGDSDCSLDGVGFGLGYLHDRISPLAHVSLVGELTINEWNNRRKPQIMLEDASVEEWQLFDVRGVRKVSTFLADYITRDMLLVAFNEKTVQKEEFASYIDQVRLINSAETIKELQGYEGDIVLLDVPPSLATLKTLMSGCKPARVYMLFLTEEDHFLNTVPTRDHFKWYYGFLFKKGPFDLKRYKQDLALHKGWTKETIDFMSQVFFELEFATIENGVISLVQHTPKRDLIESVTYKTKQEQLKVEKELIYRSYGELKELFEHFRKSSVINEEEIS